jgi:hypothetical protein
LKPAPLPHSHSKDVEVDASELKDDLDMEPDADTLLLKGMLSAILTFKTMSRVSNIFTKKNPMLPTLGKDGPKVKLALKL